MLLSGVLLITIGSATAGFWDMFSSPEAPVAPLSLVSSPIWHIHKYHGVSLRPVQTDTWEPEVVNLARVLGLQEAQLPSPRDVMALLGVSTQAEAVEAIREIAATPDGVAAVKNYLGSASQVAPQRVAPPTHTHTHHRTDIDSLQTVLTGERVAAVNALTSASVTSNE